MVFKIERYDDSNVWLDFLKESLKDYDVHIYTSSGNTITIPNNYRFEDKGDCVYFYNTDGILDIGTLINYIEGGIL